MSSPGTRSAALDFLHQWWQETSDVSDFDRLLAGWVEACGWVRAGFIWPAEGSSCVTKSTAAGDQPDPSLSAELAEVTRSLRMDEKPVVVTLSSGHPRAFAAVCPAGRPLGVLWADRMPEQAWSEEDRSYLALTGKMLERSPALAALIGTSIDPVRLSQRLTDAATVAGRMAHDFDNILTGIMGFADLTVPLLPPGSQQQSFVSEIAKVGQRGIAFTKQLHQLSRSAQVRPTPGSVPAALAREEARLKPALNPGLHFDKDLPHNLPAVGMDSAPLQTVLGHVLENAMEACPKGGTVKVSALVAELSETDARSYLGNVAAGTHVVITVTDTGPGIPAEARRRMFVEPFFTTKVRHRGLGLGVCYRIVSSHRGGIQVESVPPPAAGARVQIALPLAPHRSPAVSDATPPPAISSGRSNTVGMSTLKSTIVRG